MGIITQFIKKTNSGYISKKMYQCPDCKQDMRRNTLVRDMTPREWAIWLYASIRVYNKKGDKFYDRIAKTPSGKFVLADRIYNMGVSDEFWEGWSEAKTYDEKKLSNAVKDNTYIPRNIQMRLI
jgi:uncharacterized protein (UPF0212 family)